MVWHCFLRKNKVYLPTVGHIKGGPYRDIDPVFVIPVDDSEGIRSALKKVIATGNPILTDSSSELSLLKLAGVKGWGAFMNGAFSWTVNDLGEQCKVVGKRKGKPRGWYDDPDQTVILPAGATTDDICNQLIAMVQAKAAAQ